MDTQQLAYERAKAAREAAEALLTIVSPGLRWEGLKAARSHLEQLRDEERACYLRCVPYVVVAEAYLIAA
jgi:hypothetical protein